MNKPYPIPQKRTASTAGSLLRQWLSEKIEVNPAYSLRSMARGCGVSPGFLSQVMSGKKNISAARAVQFSQLMRLDADATNELLRAVTVERVPVGNTRTALQNIMAEPNARDEFRFVELERFRVLSQWYHLAILDLSETKGFKADPAWIARRLKISPTQAASALERLQDLNLLVKKGARWAKSDSRLAFVASQSNAAIREHHKQMMGKALECLADATPAAFEKRSITGITLSVDPKKIPEAFKAIDKFRKKMESLLAADNATEVYQMNIQLFNLSHPLKNQESSQ